MKCKRILKADNGKVTQVIEYESGTRVEIPLDRTGQVKWFDDNKLLKKNLGWQLPLKNDYRCQKVYDNKGSKTGIVVTLINKREYMNKRFRYS